MLWSHAPFVIFNVNAMVLILSEKRMREGDLISVGMSKEIVSAVAATNDVSVSKKRNVFFQLSSCCEVQNFFGKTYDPVL